MKGLPNILLCSFLCIVACTKEVPYIPDNADDLLLMNAQIDAATSSHCVWLGLSKTSTIDRLEDASVVCFVNGEEVSRGVFDKTASESAIQSCYSFNAELHPGDVIRLSADVAGLSAFAEVTVPDTTGRMLRLDTLSTTTGMRFISQFLDNAPENNFYRLRLKVRSFQSYYYEGIWSRWYAHSDEKVIEHSNDPILDNRIGGSDGDDFFGIGGSSNHYCIFTDRLFAESGADLAFTVDDADLYQVFAEQYFDKLRVIPFVEVSLISMDRAEYDYLSIQNVLYDNDYDTSDFLEPVTVPTNVMGGTGFVGVYNPSSIIIRLPEKVYGGILL
jgi:hypothetical protein